MPPDSPHLPPPGDAPKEKGTLYDFLLKRTRTIAEKPLGRDEKLFAVCSLLGDFVPAFDWVGFYLPDPKADRELVLGPFVGKPTEHVRIAFGRGICGQVAESEETLIVQDVGQEGNYLACSPEVKAEIVVPLFKQGQFAGELDIDSEQTAPFDDEDRTFLEKVGRVVEGFL